MKTAKAPANLIYVNDNQHGYLRIGEKEDFKYTTHQGNPITDEKVLARIHELVIPPDWKNVWICKNSRGHIQATGRDSKGRKQYIYHTRYAEHINQQKFENLILFAQKLPIIRRNIAKDLKLPDWEKRKVVALAIKLMDELHLRIGNKTYEEENGTYGLTTLRKKHLKMEKEQLLLKYQAKSGKLRKIKVHHPTLKKMLTQCSELPGYEIFRYKSGSKYFPINSDDVNEYLREIASDSFTAKYFRTWGGTVLTVKLEPEARRICELYPKRKLETNLVRLVAEQLNNTVAVCRKYYIHPEVLKIAVQGKLDDYRPNPQDQRKNWYRKDELTVLNIIDKT